MKKILLLILSVSGLFSSVFVKAQSFSVQADTVWATASTSGLTHIADTISVASGSASLKWKVKESNFPADWQVDTVLGICDAFICRQNTGGSLWNGTSGTYYTCMYPGTGNSHDFHFQLDMYPSGSPSSVSSGTHYITILVNDPITTDARTMTFIVTKPYPAAVTNVNTNQNDVVMYPNPARDELNVVYSANADVKTIAVYNIIGKIMTVYKVAGSSANLNLENMPSGIYFVRLANSHGDVVVTRKFTKQ